MRLERRYSKVETEDIYMAVKKWYELSDEEKEWYVIRKLCREDKLYRQFDRYCKDLEEYYKLPPIDNKEWRVWGEFLVHADSEEELERVKNYGGSSVRGYLRRSGFDLDKIEKNYSVYVEVLPELRKKEEWVLFFIGEISNYQTKVSFGKAVVRDIDVNKIMQKVVVARFQTIGDKRLPAEDPVYGFLVQYVAPNGKSARREYNEVKVKDVIWRIRHDRKLKEEKEVTDRVKGEEKDRRRGVERERIQNEARFKRKADDKERRVKREKTQDAERIKREEEYERKKVKEKERSKLTKSMRYDVIKRDSFKCVLCGRGGSDGVTLEVDHIIPVSRGGRTEMSNLRTLCRDCNRGKGAKY